MSINAINGVNNFQQANQQVQAIKPETQKELQSLGINSQNIKTETQAQEIIKEFQELQRQQQQISNAGAAQGVQQQPNVQDINPTQQVNGVQDSQQVQAFAGGQAASANAQQAQPFEMMNQIIAQQNRLKLGLI